MDEITSSGGDRVEIVRCRELLEDDGIGLSDEEVDRVREHADVVARVLIELFLKNRKTHETMDSQITLPAGGNGSKLRQWSVRSSTSASARKSRPRI
jgi:hypothetical protein